MIRKPIKAGQTQVDLFKADLVANKQVTEDKKTAKSMISSVKNAQTSEVPWRLFFGHEWEGHSFEELTILTPDPAQAAAEINGRGALRGSVYG